MEGARARVSLPADYMPRELRVRGLGARTLKKFNRKRNFIVMDPMTFEVMLPILKSGKQCRRTVWQDGVYIFIQKPYANEANTLPYIYVITAEGERVPHVASHSDILGADWVVVPDPVEK